MSSDVIAKTVGKKLRYYFEVKRLEDGFDLSGVNSPQLFHPPLKSRSTLQYDGLHDRALKHYFSQPAVKTRLTQMNPDNELPEENTKKIVKRYMYKHRFVPPHSESTSVKSDLMMKLNQPKKIVGYHLDDKSNHGTRKQAWQPNSHKHPTMPDWMYKHQPRQGKVIKPEYVGFGVGLKSKKHKALKGGFPMLRSVPSQRITKGEATRLIDIATKILVATEKVDDLQTQSGKSKHPKQTAPQPFETSKPLPGHSTRDGQKKKRPSTAKYTWDIHGRRHVRVKEGDSQSDDGARPLSEKRRAYDDSFIPDWLMRQQHEEPPKEERPPTPEPKPSPRPKSAKYRQRDQPTVINVPEPRREREDVAVNEGTQTADTVGIQTERFLLEKYDHNEDEVMDGPRDEYQLYVRTGDRVGAATKADVRVTLYGEKGRTKEFLLGKSARNKIKFQRGKEDVFLVAAYHVGKLRKIKIGHDRPEHNFDWYLDGVSVYDMHDKRIYEFPYNDWIAGQYGDKKTYKVLSLHRERAFVEAYDDIQGRESPRAGKDRVKRDDASSESKASKNDKRSITSIQGSRGEHHSDTDTSYSSDTLSSTSSSSSDSRRRGRKGKKSASPRPRSKTPPKPRDLTPPRSAAKDDFFDKASGPTFTFRSYSEDGGKREEEYLTGYKAGLEAAASEKKHQHEHEDQQRKRILAGQTIHDAARTGNLERMQELINYFPELKEDKDESGLTPLHIASQQGRLELVKWLTACSINLNTETQTGYTAIHLAAMNGHVNCMIVLAAMGATLTCRSVDRQTPLHVAAMNGHLECVKWLIANRATLDAEDQLGRTPLELAEEYQHQTVANFIQKCLDESQDPNSSMHALRTSKKGTDWYEQRLSDDLQRRLTPIKEDSQRERYSDKQWQNDAGPDSERANVGSDEEGRMSRRKSREYIDAEDLKEKRRVYEEQHQRMERTHTSFLDSIRDELDS